MDTSEQYIKMCEKAGEIQKEWKPKWGDWAWYKLDFPHLELIDKNQLPIVIEVIRRESTWLPRQDQLQEMVWKNGISYIPFMLDTFWAWYQDYGGQKALLDKWSMEQLWLAFVMKEKFNKTWNGEHWI